MKNDLTLTAVPQQLTCLPKPLLADLTKKHWRRSSRSCEGIKPGRSDESTLRACHQLKSVQFTIWNEIIEIVVVALRFDLYLKKDLFTFGWFFLGIQSKNLKYNFHFETITSDMICIFHNYVYRMVIRFNIVNKSRNGKKLGSIHWKWFTS